MESSAPISLSLTLPIVNRFVYLYTGIEWIKMIAFFYYDVKEFSSFLLYILFFLCIYIYSFFFKRVYDFLTQYNIVLLGDANIIVVLGTQTTAILLLQLPPQRFFYTFNKSGILEQKQTNKRVWTRKSSSTRCGIKAKLVNPFRSDSNRLYVQRLICNSSSILRLSLSALFRF